MSTYVPRPLAMAVLFAFAAAWAWAQSSNAQLTGLVTDSSGASIPGVAVKVVNTATNVNYQAVTNDSGVYVIPQLIPGAYDVTVSKTGFQPYSQTGLVLRTAERGALNITLVVDSVRTEVTVSSQQALLRTDDTATASVLDNAMITRLPQLSRNTLDFVKVAPEVTGSPHTLFDGVTTALVGPRMAVGGGQVAGTLVTVDGAIMQEGEDSAVNRALPSPDAVNEFRVQTGVLTADMGRYSGGIITMSTQSGGNKLHGRLFEYFRNQALNANTWSNNSLGVQAKSAFHQNNYGFSVGGPVVIPGLYSGKDRTFFHFGWEGERYVTGSLSLNSVPTELERQGDFSQSIITVRNGQPVYASIFDPFNAYESADGQWVRPIFPGARIPKTQQSRVFQNYLPLWPAANHAPDANSSSTNNYWSSVKRERPTDRHSLRLDHNFNSDHRVNLRATRYRSSNLESAPFFHGRGTTTYDHNWSSSLQYTWIATPTSVLDIRMGFTHSLLWDANGSESDGNIDFTKWGFDPVLLNTGMVSLTSVPPAVGGPYSQGSATGYAAIGGLYADLIVQQTSNVSISYSKIVGRHTFKAGFQHYYTIYHEDGGEQTGILGVRPGGGSNQYWDKNDGLSGHRLAELMMGSVVVSNRYGRFNIVPFSHSQAAFLMDDWKVTPRMNVQLGIRWDRDGPRRLRYPRTGQVFDRTAKNVLTPNAGWNWNQVIAATPGLANYPQPSWITEGVNGRVALINTPEYPRKDLYSTDWANFQPRVGISYAIDNSTVFRTAAGMIYQGLNGLTSANYSFYYFTPTYVSQPTLDNKRWISELSGEHGLPVFPRQPDGSMLGFNAPVRNNQEFWNLSYGSCPSPTICRVLETHMTSPQEYVWSAGLQRAIGKSWVVSADYTGTRGIHLLTEVSGLRFTNTDPAYYSLGDNLQKAVPNPFYGQSQNFLTQQTIPLYRLLNGMPQYSDASVGMAPWGKMLSHFLNLQVQTRNYRGLSLMASYVIRKTLTNAGGKDFRNGSTLIGQNPFDMDESYTVATYEVPQRLLFNYSYELPFGRGKAFLNATGGFANKLLDVLVGGWGFAGYTTFEPKGSPVMGPNVSGSRTAPGSVVRWSVKEGTPYLNSNADYESALVVSGKFVNSAPQGVFNRDAFVRTPNYTFGNIPLVFPNVRRPGWFDTDATMMKNFYFSENRERYVNFRIEALNFFNHPNFGSVNNNPDSSVFGGINGKSGSRTMQLGLRIFF